MSELPEFEDPPVVEVALSAQFRILPGLRGLTLAPLYEQWRDRYPRVEEQPPLPSTVEGIVPGGPAFQLNVGLPSVRYWFLTDDGTELVQLQQDRLSVNWREQSSEKPYPRYTAMRQLFVERFRDLETFAAQQGMGKVQVTQLELSYVNAVTIDPGDRGKLGRILTTWHDVPDAYLGDPEQAQLSMSYQVKELGAGISRLWVQAGPGQRVSGAPAMLLTLLVRGAPAGEGIDEILAFLDSGHQHLVRSFAELTTPEMHTIWRWRRP
ncbi:MAG TPA: TIGR04255 family protein [Chloroflexota bacterium]